MFSTEYCLLSILGQIAMLEHIHSAAEQACLRVYQALGLGPWESLAGQLVSVNSYRAGSSAAGALARACGPADAGPSVESNDRVRLCICA